jgi:hypothetical protein
VGTWTRATPWRQGAVLTSEAVAALQLSRKDGKNSVAVVISHDCDCAQLPTGEPATEIILGRRIDAVNGTYAFGKNTRRLHLPFSAGSQTRIIELEFADRVFVPKEVADAASLSDFSPDETIRLAAPERHILKRWLAARYNRSAFPDEFDRRLNDERVAEGLAKAFKETGEHIPAVFFDVDRGEELTRDGPDDLYGLFILIVFSTAVDAQKAEAAAQQARQRIIELFERRCQKNNVWKWIELEGIEVISDEALTFAQSQRLTAWNADYVSLRADPQQPIVKT